MIGEDSRTLTGPRASSAVICPRRAVYEGLGIEREPNTPAQEGYFRRGRFMGLAMAHDLQALLAERGRPPAELEVEVPWPKDDPIGVGHADAYVTDTLTIVEYVSSVGCDLPRHKPLQAGLYALHHPEATSAVVISVDPSSFAEQAYPLDLEGREEEVERIVDTVVRGVRDGELPERAMRQNGEGVVEGPSEWPCFDCPFRRTCWKEWEPWPTAELPDSYAPKALRLAELIDLLARYKQEPEAEREQKELRAELRARMSPGVTYTCAGLTLRFTEVAPSRRFSLSDAEKAGHALPEHLEAFVTESGGHERWTVRRSEED